MNRIRTPECSTTDHGRNGSCQLEAFDAWKDPAVGARYNLGDMLLRGGTDGADALCWVTSEAVPDRWPVVVWARHGGGRSVYECGMTEFLVRVLRADFDECPVSNATLWGEGTARLLNFREEERFLDEGVDPWTGESLDPFAGL